MLVQVQHRMRIGDVAESCLRTLPKQHRDRLMRAFAAEAGAAALLAHLLSDDDTDAEWIGELINDKVIEPVDVLHSLNQHDDPDDVRARRTAALGAVLIAHGVEPASVARTAMFDTWMGNECSRYEKLRAAFEALEANGNPQAGAVRAAGMELSPSFGIALWQKSGKMALAAATTLAVSRRLRQVGATA
jgi:hypothetical protein